MKNLLVVLFVFAFAGTSRAQDLIEVRSASRGEYLYADWSHSFKNKVATDVYYIGVPGNNEVSACGGYSLPTFAGFSLTPFFCGTVAKENKELGVKAAFLLTFEKGKYKADAYYARFQSLKGNVKAYDVLDAGNLTYSVTKRWDIGISTGFFKQGHNWNPQYGGIAKFNDKLGNTAISYRIGVKELRVSRVFITK